MPAVVLCTLLRRAEAQPSKMVVQAVGLFRVSALQLYDEYSVLPGKV